MVGVRMVRHIAQWLGLEWFVILHNGWGQNGSSYCTLVGVRMVRHIAQWLGLEWLSISQWLGSEWFVILPNG